MGRISEGSQGTGQGRISGGRISGAAAGQPTNLIQQYEQRQKATKVQQVLAEPTKYSPQEQYQAITEGERLGLINREERNKLFDAIQAGQTEQFAKQYQAPAFQRGVVALAEGLSEGYRRLGQGYGEVLGQLTGVSEGERRATAESQRQSQDIINTLNKKIADPNVSALEKERARQAIIKIAGTDLTQAQQFGETQAQIAERTNVPKALGALGQVGLDVLTAGTAGTVLKGAKAASAAQKIARAGRAVGTGAGLGAGYGATSTLQQLGTEAKPLDYAKAVATGAALGGAVGVASELIAPKILNFVKSGGLKTAGIADKQFSKLFTDLGNKISQTKAGGKLADLTETVSQKFINNLTVLNRKFAGLTDTSGRQVNEVIREYAGNVRQSAGLAAQLRRENQAFQQLSKLLTTNKKEVKGIANYIQERQNAINKAKLTGEKLVLPKGTPIQETAYQLLNKSTKREIQYAFDKGLITRPQYEKFMKDPNYTRVQRDMEGVILANQQGRGRAEASLSSTEFQKKLKGSERAAVDPFTAYVDWSNRIVEQGERNIFATYVINQLDNLGQAQLVKPGKATGVPTLARFEDGVKQLYRTDPNVVNSIKNMDKVMFGSLQKYITIPSRLLQMGATTANIAFGVPNFVRDQVSSFILSKHGLSTHSPMAFWLGIKEATVKPTVNATLRGLGFTGKNEIKWKPSAQYTEYLSRNANMTSVDLVRELKSATRQAYEELGLKGETPLRKLESIVSATEKATRYQNFIGEYRRAIRKGESVENAYRIANQAARENSIDFSQRGELATFARLFNPYFNAAVQGGRGLARAFKERPVATSIKIGTTILGPVALSTYYNLSDPQRAYIYARIPEYERKSNLIFVLADGSYAKIPLTPGIREFAQPLRNLIESEYIGDRQSFAETARQLFIAPFSPIGSTPEEIAASALPQAVKPAIENIVNYSLFRQAPIVGEYMQNRPPSEQVYKTTSQTYRDIGAATGLSPLQIQNLIAGYGAGGAEQLITAIDQARKTVSPDVVAAPRTTAEQIQARFYRQAPSETSNAVVTEFYKRYQPLQKEKTYVSGKVTDLVKDNKIAEAQKLVDNYNKKIDEQENKFKTSYGRYEKNSALLTQLNTLKIKLTPQSIKRRQAQ